MRQIFLAIAFVLSASTVLGQSFTEKRVRMVEVQIAPRGITDSSVLRAMATVARHRFVPESYVDNAYSDRPLPIGYGQTISQPYIVALMTQLLELEPGDRVLEIGTGSGYQAAVLAEILDDVYTIEIIPELADRAAGLFHVLAYDSIRVKQADGYYGWEEYAPFDAIVVTAAAEHIPPPLVRQLKDGGRMIIPVGSPFFTQTLMLVTKAGDKVTTNSMLPVRFVPFTRSDL
ncbi:MAG: protein-L-isoaspartate(D-aspartate) O-methyltransferase [Bacteroidetes bacterium]|nr:protein-L-isoaspartate(D-aspartate) O-methyltransferase [Bacteroidota bacterium]